MLVPVDPAGFGKFKPVDSVAVIAKELKTFHRTGRKQRIIAVSKADLPKAKRFYPCKLKTRFPDRGHRLRRRGLLDYHRAPAPIRKGL